MQLFTNNAQSQLVVGITNVSLSLQVAFGDGAKFPDPVGSEFFLVTLLKVSGGIETAREIIKVTARSGDVFTIVRAQEGTTALTFAEDDYVSLRLTAAAANNMISHINDEANPHGVTKTQLGIANVDNTSDANKPVSTAQQTAIDLKRNLVETVSVTGGTFTCTAGITYILTGSSTATLPASPSVGNWVSIVNCSGLLTNTIARNGQNIMGLAEDMTLDNMNASLTLLFTDATRGWVWA